MDLCEKKMKSDQSGFETHLDAIFKATYAPTSNLSHQNYCSDGRLIAFPRFVAPNENEFHTPNQSVQQRNQPRR